MGPQEHLKAAHLAADAAGAVIRPYFRQAIAADQKADNSPVTLADRGAEQAMRDILAQLCPGYGILGEEMGLQNPSHPYRWVLDPIDGTRAFITGRPIFGTLIALLHHDTPVLGVLDQPVTGERWVGAVGQPTQFTGAFGTPGTRACPSLSEAELSCTSPAMLGPHAPAWQKLADSVKRVTWGGDCYAYGLLALGQIDIIAETDLKIWDWAALMPIIEGAGGRVTDWAGHTPHAQGDGRILATGNPALHAAALEKLNSPSA